MSYDPFPEKQGRKTKVTVKLTQSDSLVPGFIDVRNPTKYEPIYIDAIAI